MLRRFFLKSSAVAIVSALCNQANAQLRLPREDDENFKINNTNPFDLHVAVSANDVNGIRKVTNATFAARQEQQLLLGPDGAGFQPFDIAIEINGTVVTMAGVNLCTMMQICKASQARSMDFDLQANVQPPDGTPARKAFVKARSAWRHVTLTF